jgi:hypothetical protein
VKVVEADAMEYKVIPTGRGPAQETKILAMGELVPGMNFWLNLWRFGKNGPFETPRHHHTFQQVRYVVEGVANIGPKKDLHENWVGYFPAGAYYGPQRDGGGTVLYLQFGEGFITEEQQQQAFAEMEEAGTLKDGVYTDVDPDTGKKRNRDAVQAMYEWVNGRKLEFPEPRYPDPIMINPAAFNWVSLNEGLLQKPLGTFTERQVAMSMLRWEDSGSHEFPSDSTQLVFSTTEGLRAEGSSRPSRTSIWSPYNESLELDGDPGAEALMISVPAIGPASASVAA